MAKICTRPVPENNRRNLENAGINPLLARIFASRGVTSPVELENALRLLIHPEKMLNLSKAASFLADAIAKKQKMTVIADYDCDGATACSVAVQGIQMLGGNISYIIPNRFENGYGLTPQLAEKAFHEEKAEILITVDNGISSIDGVARAVELGMQVLVTDHHLPGKSLPSHCIIVNPNQNGCPFPSKNLAGVGVIFYVLLGTRAEMRRRGIFTKETQPHLDQLLDLVALGTVSDVVPLDHNNRILVSQGLKRIQSRSFHPGISALFRISGKNSNQASVTDLGFSIGPRLNAAGRLSDMTLGVECLLSKDLATATAHAEELNRINTERQGLEEDMKQEAEEKTSQLPLNQRYSICICSENWHPGVIGLLASRIREKFFRPTIIFTSNGHSSLQGSGRSIPDLHLRNAIANIAAAHPDIVMKFGGHAMAAGLTIHAEKLQEFNQAFEAEAARQLLNKQLEPVIETDGSLDTKYLTEDFIESLNAMVWGQKFPAPVFCDEFEVVQQRILKNAHLKLQLRRNNLIFDAIRFGRNTPVPKKISIAYRPVINQFNNRKSIELYIDYIDEP